MNTNTGIIVSMGSDGTEEYIIIDFQENQKGDRLELFYYPETSKETSYMIFKIAVLAFSIQRECQVFWESENGDKKLKGIIIS